jgi:hypothetical protein
MFCFKQVMIGASKSIWGFDPRSVPEPVVWFDASDTSTLTLSGSNVTAWRDKSRNNYNAATLIGTAPTITTINGNNAVSFISNSTLTVSNVRCTTQSRAVFTVVRSDSFMTNEMTLFSRRAPNNADNQYGLDLSITSTTGAIFIRASSNTSNTLSGGIFVDSRGNTSVFCIVHSSVSTSNSFITGNGVTAPLTASQLATVYNLNQSNWYLGSAYPTNLTLCEFMMYEREFTLSELRQMEGYLADKWKIQTSLPLIHPHRSIKPHLTTFRPNDILGCELWFDGADYRTMFQDTAGTTPVTSSGQSVARWTDKIQNLSISNTGVPGQSMLAPTSVSGGGVFFNNTSTVVSASAQGLGTSLTGATNQTAFLFRMPTRSMTMITVSYPLSNNLLRQICCIASDPIGGGGNFPNFSMGHEIGAGNGGTLLFDWNGSTWGQIAQSTSGYNSNTVLRIDSLIANSTPIWLTNGNSNTFTQTSNYVTANTIYPVNRIAMGGYSSTFVGSRNFHGTVYEMLLYSRVLGNEELQKVEGYLANKWGLTGPSHIQTPLSIPGCSVWFDGADTTTITGSPVTAWRDKSGNNWNATTLRGTAPTRISVNGSNAVSFAASSTLTVSNVTFSSVQSRAIFAVYRVNTSAPNYVSWFSTQSSNINNQGGHNNIVYPSGGGGPYLQSFAVGGAVQGVGADPAVSTIGSTAIACMIHSAVSTANNVVTLNGTSYPLTTNTLASGYGSGTVTYYIGNAYPQAYILCEYIMYQKEFTVFERKQVEGYLANKWGVTLSINDLPYRHLFRYRPVALVVPSPVNPLISLGANTCFIVKYNSNGNPIWARKIGGTNGTFVGYSVTRDSSQNIIVTGTYNFQVEIYDATGKNVVFTLSPQANQDTFVVKYDSSGTPLWARKISGTGNDQAISVSTDSSGNIIVVGFYASNPLNIFAADGSTVSFSLNNSGNNDAFIVKYDSNGTPLWARRIGGTLQDQANSVSVDSSGNTVVTGQYTSSSLNIYAANGTTVTFALGNSDTSTDSFLVKYDSSGTPLWARRIGGTGFQVCNSVTTDSSGNIVVTGYFGSGGTTIYAANGTTAVFTLGIANASADLFLVKYDSSGTPLWVAMMTSSGQDNVISVTTDSSGNIIVFGSCQTSPMSIGAANGSFPFQSDNGNFLVKYNSSGTPLWCVRIPPVVSIIGSVTTDSSGNIIVTGAYSANFSITFPFSTTGLASNAFNIRLVSTSQDSFVIKFNSSGTVLWVNRFGGTGTTDQVRSVCTDSSENVIVTGNYNSTSLSFYA